MNVKSYFRNFRNFFLSILELKGGDRHTETRILNLCQFTENTLLLYDVLTKSQSCLHALDTMCDMATFIDLIIMISNGIYIHEIHQGLQMSGPSESQGWGSPLSE